MEKILISQDSMSEYRNGKFECKVNTYLESGWSVKDVKVTSACSSDHYASPDAIIIVVLEK